MHTAETKLRLLVITKRFPSSIQTWLLNWIEQTLKHDVKVTISADGCDVNNLPEKIHELGLLKHTYYLAAGSNLEILRGLKSYIPFTGKNGIKAWSSFTKLYKTHPRLSFKNWLRAAVRSQIYNAGEFDLAHSHSLISSYEYLPVLRAASIPLITSFHGPTPPGIAFLSKPQLDEVFAYGALFPVNTNFAKHQLLDLGCPADKITILPQGTQLKDFPFPPRGPEVNDPIIILTVGRFQKDKGHIYALEAIAKLLQNGINIKYRMIGIGPEKQNLLDYARHLNISDRVSADGPLVDQALQKEFHQADIFLLPSLNNEGGVTVETQGVVLQEAQASGCLVIATRTGGIPEVIDDGKSAWLVPDRDANAIADKIAWLLTQTDKWDQWRREARAWVEKNFDSDQLGDKLYQLYLKVAAKPQI